MDHGCTLESSSFAKDAAPRGRQIPDRRLAVEPGLTHFAARTAWLKALTGFISAIMSLSNS